MKKRILAMVMVVMMTVAYLPAMAFASDTPSGSGMDAGGQQDINQIIKDRQVEFLNMLLPLIQRLKLDEKAGKLDELKKKISEIQGIMSLIDDASKLPKEDVGNILDLLNSLNPELGKQIDLITDFIINLENLVKAKGLNDGDVNEMTVALAKYKDTLQTLKAKIEVYLKNGNVDDNARAAMINDINDALTSVGNAQHSLKDSLIDVLTSSANQIKANSQVYVDFLKTEVAKVKAGAAAVTPQVVAKASEALGKLRESMDLLQSIVKVSQPFVTTRVTNAVNQAQEALKAGGTALQNYITTVVQKITKNPGAIITDQGSSGNGSKGNSAATNSSAITGNSASAYVSQLENAAKIVNIKPSLKSLTSKGKKVSVKWAAVKAGKISYYQVSYQQKGKKAVTKTFKKYKAAAKFITYKSKKLKKGKKYTFKVRGVYKMTAAAAGTKSKAARFYTQWSKTKTIKVK